MSRFYSFIIPVFNRPEEVNELLESLTKLEFSAPFEVVIVEDGSTLSSKTVIKDYSNKLDISYYEKSNSGPGDSRNYGMQRAKGDYFLILDSDCIIPPCYLNEVEKGLNKNYTDCFGGPDAAHQSFTAIQKAINFAMTSFLTTGGIRGGKKSVSTFEPRSFNMGLSKQAFQKTQGFGRIHPGEDPDLSIRLKQLGFNTQLLQSAYVYHKRRISWRKFYIQVNKFGRVRPILNSWHPSTRKITYWFPSVFIAGFLFSLLMALVGNPFFISCYVFYFTLLFILALIELKSIKIASLAVYATIIQFYGYGIGFFKNTIKLRLIKKSAEDIFPELFFKA